MHDAAFGETMHPGRGPWEEANRLYVRGCALEHLLGEAPPATGEAAVVVFDVGLGAAANALAALACHQERVRRGLFTRPLVLVSFEANPEGADFARRESTALGYPRGSEDTLAALLRDGAVELPGGFRWKLRLGDFPRLVQEEPLRADAIFLDPFSPASNPAMWALPVLEALHRCRRPGGAVRLATYSSAFGVRAGLLLAGFFVGEGPAPGRQGHSTLAAAYLSDLERPLTNAWLARWRKARDPWPPQTPGKLRRTLRARLLEHPQFRPAEESAPPLRSGPAAAARRGTPRGGRSGPPRRKRRGA